MKHLKYFANGFFFLFGLFTIIGILFGAHYLLYVYVAKWAMYVPIGLTAMYGIGYMLKEEI